MSQINVPNLLNKHKVISTMLEHSHQSKQELVENLVHRQHLTELENLIPKLEEKEIIKVLDELSNDDCLSLWKHVQKSRRDELLLQLSDEKRELLLETLDQDTRSCQINAFELRDGRLEQLTIHTRRDLDGIQPIWIDILGSSSVHRELIGSFYDVTLPDPDEAMNLEVTSRFHVEENDDIHLHSNFLSSRGVKSKTVSVAFVFHNGILFSLRDEELSVFRLQRLRARARKGYVTNNLDIVLDLYGADVEYTADSLENIYSKLRIIGNEVLDDQLSDHEAAEILTEISEAEDLNGLIRGNLLDTERALNFLMQGKNFTSDQYREAKQVLKNTESLNSHTTFLFDKINFLMDSTIGFININQNRRINKLTFFGVVFMPLNILAGIGGMSEFSMMTEGVPWPIAYGSFMMAMIVIGWATYVTLQYFESRKMRIQSLRKAKLKSEVF